jgi:translation initiation factor 2-alpha kinase 3
MSPKYWASSEDLSVDSSIEGSQNGLRRSRDSAENEENEEYPQGSEQLMGEESSAQESNPVTVARTMRTNVVLPRLPDLQPHQHASLFYLSLIEGRCRTQAAHTINADRSPEHKVTEDHPEVLGLAQHLFGEMQRELVKAGMIPEEFAEPILPDLRQYLNSFDTLLNNIATKRKFNLSDQHSHRALRGFESPSFNSNLASNASLFSYNPAAFGCRKSIMPPQSSQVQRLQPLSKLLLFFHEVHDTTISKSIYEGSYVQ